MICQSCGEREATVHFSDPGHSPRRFQWLCSRCADLIVSSLVSASTDDKNNNAEDKQKAWDPTAINEEITKSKKGELLGKMFGLSVDDQGDDDRACSQCGLKIKQIRQAGFLGCPTCYIEFREVLRPFLARLHGHTSHLGRIPGQASGMASAQVKVMRLRVDLEKAIAAEDFEKAAGLRDEITALRGNSEDTDSGENGAIS